MSQKISPISLRLYNRKGFHHSMYSDLNYMQLWKKNFVLLHRYYQIYKNYGLLKLRRNQINRRLRLKHNMSMTSLNIMANIIVSNLPYKEKLNLFIFKKPLFGIQFNYSIRPVQRRKKQGPSGVLK